MCDRFAAKHRFGPTGAKFQGEFARGRALGADVALLKPQTFMNLSGESVAEALRYLPVEPADVVVVFDEMDIPSGRLRIRLKGGHGGHNGLRSIIEALGTQDFPRIRIGVGRPPEGWEATGHLLSEVPRASARASRRGRPGRRRGRGCARPGRRDRDEPLQRLAADRRSGARHGKVT